ncbi:MAG: LapA family protein [Flavobacteriaceae bacterium]
MRIVKKIFLILFLILIVIFSVQNSQTISIDFFNWSVKLPVSLIIILVYILGMTTGGIISSVIRSLAEPKKAKPKDDSQLET